MYATSYLDYFYELYETIDYRKNNQMSFNELLSFCRLFYRSDNSYQCRLFYRKLRFYYHYYLNKSLIKLEDLDESMILYDDEVEAQDESKIFSDPRMDIYFISKNDFFKICCDLKLFGQNDLYKSKRILTLVFLKVSDEILLDEYTLNKILFCKKKEKYKSDIKESNETDHIQKENFDILLTSLETLSEETKPHKKTIIRFLIQYRILLNTYQSTMMLECKDLIHLRNLDISKVYNTIKDQNIL